MLIDAITAILVVGALLLIVILVSRRVSGRREETSSTKWPLEQEVTDFYVATYQTQRGMAPSKAIASVREMIEHCKKEAEAAGTNRIPPGFGDRLLEEAHAKDGIRALLTAKRSDGVRDDDVRWWWNLAELERRAMMFEDNATRLMVFTEHVENGKTDAEAAACVRRAFPTYGDPSDTTWSSGEDRPLPYELKERVNAWFQRAADRGREKLKAELDAESSVNAFVRRKVREGSL
jgi:hypothetical protein